MLKTCKNYVYGKAPGQILLKGDSNHPESAEHIIVFPGGSIGVCRTSNNEYWAHIEIYKGEPGSGGMRESVTASVVAVRVDNLNGVQRQLSDQLEELDILHLAVRVKGSKDSKDAQRGFAFYKNITGKPSGAKEKVKKEGK